MTDLPSRVDAAFDKIKDPRERYEGNSVTVSREVWRAVLELRQLWEREVRAELLRKDERGD